MDAVLTGVVFPNLKGWLKRTVERGEHLTSLTYHYQIAGFTYKGSNPCNLRVSNDQVE